MTNFFDAPPKDPAAVLDYGLNWQARGWLAAGETIVSSTWTATPGITIDTTSNTATTATVWLSGGTARRHYTVTNHITTSAGRADERSINVHVIDR